MADPRLTQESDHFVDCESRIGAPGGKDKMSDPLYLDNSAVGRSPENSPWIRCRHPLLVALFDILLLPSFVWGLMVRMSTSQKFNRGAMRCPLAHQSISRVGYHFVSDCHMLADGDAAFMADAHSDLRRLACLG